MTTLAVPAAVTRPTRRSSLPPAGPAWYPSVMGTGILATLTQIHIGSTAVGRVLAVGWLVIAWALLVTLSVVFAGRIAADRRALTSTIHDPTNVAMWGTVSMGLLAVGAATDTVLPALSPGRLHLAWSLDVVLWTLGTVLGVVTALGFASLLVRRDIGTPTAVWGLPIVPPMVSATTGSALVPQVASPEGRLWLTVITVACFFLALSLGAVVFGVVYHSHWRHSPVPLAASASTWIPLGIVGQSTAAAQAMAAQAERDLDPALRDSIQHLANVYGWVTLAIGVPLVAYAVVVTVRGFVRRMPFNLGWWALTFPIGTLSLGSHLLGIGASQPGMSLAGRVAWLTLVGTWSLCAVGTVRGLVRRPALQPA